MKVAISELTSAKEASPEDVYAAWNAVVDSRFTDDWESRISDLLTLTQREFVKAAIFQCGRNRIHYVDEIYTDSLYEGLVAIKRFTRASRPEPLMISPPPYSLKYFIAIIHDLVGYALRNKSVFRKDVALVPAEVAESYYGNLAAHNPYSWKRFHNNYFLKELPMVMEKFLVNKSRFPDSWDAAIEYCSRRYCEGKIPPTTIIKGAYRVDTPEMLRDWCKIWLRYYLKTKGLLDAHDESFEYNVIYPTRPGDIKTQNEY